MRLRLGIVLCACLLAIAGTAAGFTFSDPALDAAVRSAAGYSGDPTGDITAGQVAGITTLNAAHLGITDLTGIENLTNLTDLDLGFNQISSVAALTTMTNLVSLDLGFHGPLDDDFDPENTNANQITNVAPLGTLVNLQYLNLGGNSGVTDIGIISNMPALTQLLIGYGPIADFSPLNDVASQLLLFLTVGNGLDDTDVEQIVSTMVNLRMLGLSSVSDISSLSTLTSLTGVMLGACTITDYSVMEQWPSLQQLVLLLCPSLTSLDDFSGLNLSYLAVKNCSLADISAVSGMTNLSTLILNNNQITSLTDLLANTGLGAGDTVNIDGNPLTQETVCLQLPQLVNQLQDGTLIASGYSCDSYSFSMTVTGTGIVSPAEGVSYLPANSQVALAASPVNNSGFAFDHWVINGNDVPTNPYTITLADDTNVEAVFTNTGTVTLTLAADGPGTPGMAPGEYSYLPGTNLILLAVPDSGKFFGGWTGDIASMNPLLNFTIASDMILTANFSDAGYTITVNVDGTGAVNPSVGTYTLASGSQLILSAINIDPAYGFFQWEEDGAPVSQFNSYTVTADDDKTVTAVFKQWSLTMNVDIPAGGAGGTDPADGQVHTYAHNSQVALTATPANDRTYFDHWEGLPEGIDITNSSAIVTITGDMNVTAFFVVADLQLNLTVTGPGNITPAPDTYWFLQDTYADLTATPATSLAAFIGWRDLDSGDLLSESQHFMLLVSTTMNVVAEFATADFLLNILPATNGATNPPENNSYGFLNGQTTSVVAIPDATYAFSHWINQNGDTIGTDRTLFLTMTNNFTVVPVFVSGDVELTITTSGVGAGSVDPAPGNYWYLNGFVETLKASTGSGGYFAGWTVDSGAKAPVFAGYAEKLEVTMDSDKTVDAAFVDSGYTVTVAKQGAPGVTTPDEGSYALAAGANLDLLAYTSAPYRFVAWKDLNGTVLSEDPAYTIANLASDVIAIAVFETIPTYSLTINVDGQGTTSPPAGTHPAIEEGQEVQIAAIPAEGWEFNHWEDGNGTPINSISPLTLTMDQNYTVVAVFTQMNRLSITLTGTGSGTTAPAAGIDHFYSPGAEVILTATPAVGSMFTTWGGELSEVLDPASVTITVVMDQNRTISAEFTAKAQLTITIAGGSGTTSPAAGGVQYYVPGTVAVVTAFPAQDWRFVEWGGDLPASVNPALASVQILMDQDRDITALFGQGYSLTITVTGNGSTDPAENQVHLYDPNATATLTALPALDSTFAGWSGDIAAADPAALSIQLLMDQDRVVNAAFLQNYVLMITVVGSGSTTPAAGVEHSYADGELVTLTATPDTGNVFTAWSGDIGSADPSAASIQVTMDQARNVTATFDTNPVSPYHSADTTEDNKIQLQELLRVIQFFNMGGYSCDLSGGTADGFTPGFDGDHNCTRHDSDYDAISWKISLQELLRLIQFFNIGGYHRCDTGTDDGFCPGLS